MNFMIDWQEQYQILFLPIEHKNISSNQRVMFQFLLYRHSDDGEFDNFLGDFTDDAEHCQKIAEDFRGRPEDILIMHQRI